MRFRELRSRVPRTFRRLLFLLTVPCCLLLCQCHVWRAHKSLSAVQSMALEVQEEEMEGTALYHLTTGKELVEAAEKQYEDADFTAARRFADEARRQMLRAERLGELNRRATSSTAGGTP